MVDVIATDEFETWYLDRSAGEQEPSTSSWASHRKAAWCSAFLIRRPSRGLAMPSGSYG